MSPIQMKEPPLGLLSLGFVLCGIVTVLPGPILPVLATHWGLPDAQAGGFFAAEFAASTIAAILSPRRMRWSLPRGYALITIGVFLLAVSGRAISPTVGHSLALGAFALIGFGIGLSVTATNLLVAAAAPEHRARRLSIVNIWWGIGAVACPWMAAGAEHLVDLRLLLAAVGFLSLLMFVLLLPLREEHQPPPGSLANRGDAVILVYFALLLFLYVGVENTVGGWAATYTNRFTGLNVANASITVSIFWLALLAGRSLGSLALKRVPEQAVMVPGMAVSLVAVMMLITPHSRIEVLGAIAIAGFGFGPIFPIGVSRMLARVADKRNTGWVFATCAGGGAVLPWLTGLVSTHTGSLRAAFEVPVAALAVILLLALGENAFLRNFEPEPSEKQQRQPG